MTAHRPVISSPASRPSSSHNAAHHLSADLDEQVAISVSGVTRSFGRIQALDNVSFTIPEHSICGLLGRNGAGKTTLMASLTGQDRPDDGDIRLFGSQPFENSTVQDSLSYIRDNQRYPDDYTLKQALRIAPWFHPRWSDETAEHLIDAFRLPSKTKVKKYSRGQLSALGVVIGLASRAPVTFLDEPYLGLDATARQIFYDALLEDYAAHPRTVIASTHLIDEMQPLFSHVLVLDQGRLVLDAPADELAGWAHTVSGVATRVDSFCEQGEVLSVHDVGALSTVVLAGPASQHDVDAARAAGVDIQPASLQQIVNALGADTTAPRARTESARRTGPASDARTRLSDDKELS